MSLRNAVTETLCDCSSRNALGTDNNLDLELVSKDHKCWTFLNTYLHCTVVDLDTVQLMRGLSSTSWLGEDNGGSATAAATRSVGEHDLLDSSHRFAEVVLNEFHVSPMYRSMASSPFASINARVAISEMYCCPSDQSSPKVRLARGRQRQRSVSRQQQHKR